MNTRDTKPDQQLFLFLNFVENAVSDLIQPKNNLIGGQLFGQLLDARLEAAGLLMEPTIASGPLNQSCFVCSVADVHEAAKVICALLEKSCLLPCARLYRLDVDELVYRHLYPADGQDMLFENLKRQTEVHIASGMSVLVRAAEELKKRQLPPPAGPTQ